MSARDELAEIIWDKTDCRDEESPDLAADAILAAGYSKPRIVTTMAELNALPTDTVIQSGRYVLERLSDGWYMPSMTENFTAIRNWLPATVLRESGAMA